MSGGFGARLRLRLFIEGVEVPIIAAQTQTAPNSPTSCSIQIPPLPDGLELLPRSLVHVFFLDFYEVASPFAGKASQSPDIDDLNQDPNNYQAKSADNQDPLADTSAADAVGDQVAHDAQNAKYKLLFGGEVVGFQWTKSQSQRSLVLQCLDWSNYWDYAYQWNNTDLFGPGIKAMFSGGSTNLFTDFLSDEGSEILKIIQTPSVQYPNLKGLMGGIVHLLEAIGGSYYQGKQFAGENIFFSIAELRLHITQMITAYENDPTASRLLGGGYDSLFGRTLGGLGQQVSIRQAINALMGIIFHETYAQPCPRYVPGAVGGPANTTRKNVRSDPDNAFIATTADGLIASIAQARTQNYATAPEALKISLTSMIKTCNDTIARIKDKDAQAAKGYYTAARSALQRALAGPVTTTITPTAEQVEYAKRAGLTSRAFGPSTSTVYKTPSQDDLNTAFDSAVAALQQAQSFLIAHTAKSTQAARLNQHIFRPDVWFSAPPRCNVLFPEQYHTLTYARSFLQEPTRFLLKTNDEFFGEDELFDKFYFAPKGFTLKSGGRELQNILNNDLLDHELFTGILPVFEKMGELNIFGARSGTGDGAMQKVGLAQRSTNFLYFKYRFAARQLELTGRFNPYVACGFPGLIVDKYVDRASLVQREALIEQNGSVETPDIDKLLGTHFLCDFTEVTHTVSQSEGMTSIRGGYARQPDESVEFLGVLRPDQTVKKRADTDAVRKTVVAALNSPTIHSLGPNLGDITRVEDVTEAYTPSGSKDGFLLPVYQGPTVTGTRTARISVNVGISQPAAAYGVDVVNLVGSAAEIVKFNAYRITESVPRYRKETVDLPAEEYIRPGWYGDVWHPSVISKAYQQFFLTGSITDEQQVEGLGNASLGAPYEQADNALADAAKAVDADDPYYHSPGLLALDKQSSIQAAVAFIVQTYSYVKQMNLNVDDYVTNYTWRPIATMVDLFGTTDLTLDAQGHNVIRGIEGFHSRAFGPYQDLFGLVTPDIEGIVGIKRGSTAAQRGDTRLRKQQAVQQYVQALQYGRAVLG